jgi:hypothetical protein
MAQISATLPIYDSRPTCLYLVVEGKYALTQSLQRDVSHLNRPEAVNISNVAALVDADGKPHFKYIVEGANLFFTQQARLHLEKRKVVLFKDASANKGTSYISA